MIFFKVIWKSLPHILKRRKTLSPH